jgi:hypothetical protein
MADLDKLREAIVEAQAAASKQGDVVRSLKAELKDGKIDRVRRPSLQLHRTLVAE